MPEVFRYQTEWSTQFFSTLRQNISDRKPWYLPRMRKIFRLRKTFEAHKCPSTIFFRLRDWNFQRKIVIPSAHIHKFFRCQKKNGIQKGSSTTSLATVRQKNSDIKTSYPPPMQKGFRYRTFSETQKDRILSFLVHWDKIVPTEKRNFPLDWKIFVDTGIFLKHRSVLVRNFLVFWDKISPTKKRDSPSYGYILSKSEFLWNTKRCLHEVFR